MTNPDNNFDLWLYKLNGKTYIPSLEITKNGLKEFAYEYKNYNRFWNGANKFETPR